MKKGNKILITIIIGLILVAVFYFIANAITKYTGYSVSVPDNEKSFEECLKTQDITLYINSNNPTDTLRNIKLLDYLDNFKIINCFRDNDACLNAGVESFPNWIINNHIIKEDISLSELSELSGCNLNS